MLDDALSSGMGVSMYVCVHAYVRACLCVCVCVCVCAIYQHLTIVLWATQDKGNDSTWVHVVGIQRLCVRACVRVCSFAYLYVVCDFVICRFENY